MHKYETSSPLTNGRGVWLTSSERRGEFVPRSVTELGPHAQAFRCRVGMSTRCHMINRVNFTIVVSRDSVAYKFRM